MIANGASDHREPGFGVYVHWPFCAQKCPYCDFNSHVRFDGWDETRFLAAYRRELDTVAARVGQQEVQSVFFGGGTPSLMQPETVAGILNHISSLWSVRKDAEITLEANPGSVEAGRFAGYRSAGVNRVSIGVQSLRNDALKRLGRIHTVDEAKAALEIAQRTVERYSFDLIYARPEQTTSDWRTELGEALQFAGGHVSLYQLTIEPDTPFADLFRRGRLVIPNPDAALALYEVTQELTDQRGLASYEISNHAAAGEESAHNLLYWRYGAYAGVGPGAHGRLPVENGRLATLTERVPEAWVAKVEKEGTGLVELEPLDRSAIADEILLMGLRLSEGLDLDHLARLGGVTPVASAVRALEEAGVMEWVTLPAPHSLGRIRAIGQGRFILNELVLKLSREFKDVETG